jgi:hypothetical protein
MVNKLFGKKSFSDLLWDILYLICVRQIGYKFLYDYIESGPIITIIVTLSLQTEWKQFCDFSVKIGENHEEIN